LFRLNCNNSPFIIQRLEKDPNRTGFIALCKSLHSLPIPTVKNNLSVKIKGFKYFYILAPHNVTAGSIIYPNLITLGSVLPLNKIQLGSIIHNVEFNGKAKLARSAGTYCTVISQNTNTTIIKLPSKKLLELPSNNKATIGMVSNIFNSSTSLGKAGASR
jgi:large subunit ribosomal protein L2